MDPEKLVLRKVGEAISRYQMIRPGDRVAVGLSGGKDSVTLLEALVRLQRKAPIEFSVCAFTIEQGKFLAPIKAFTPYLAERGIPWTCVEDNASLRLLDEQPDHGCDLCSRFRRRAVYEGQRMGPDHQSRLHHVGLRRAQPLRLRHVQTRGGGLHQIARRRPRPVRHHRQLSAAQRHLDRHVAAVHGRSGLPRLLGGKAPVGYIGEPEDVAAPALFLASEESRFINGMGFRICGGAMARF